jgi:hypothetical protein
MTSAILNANEISSLYASLLRTRAMPTDHEPEGRIHGQQQEVQITMAEFLIHGMCNKPGAHVIKVSGGTGSMTSPQEDRKAIQ